MATSNSAYGNIGQPNETYLSDVSGSAVGQAMQDLADFGLSPQLASQAIAWYNQQENALVDPAQMQINMYQTDWFKAAFPGIIQQINNGQSPMTPTDYVAFEQGVVDFASQYGLPQNFISKQDIADMIGQGWTFSDVQTRLGLAFQASSNAAANNPEAVALLDQWYGIAPGSGNLAAFYLNPSKTVNLLSQATSAAQAGATAETAGYTGLTQKDLMAMVSNTSLASVQSALTSNTAIGLLPTQKAALGPGPSATASAQDIVAATQGGIPGVETAQQGINKVNVAVGQRNQGLGGGGGFQGQGTKSATGEGYASQ